MVTIKTNFHGDVRRFCLSETASFEELLCNICCVYKRHDSLSISYLDDENDEVTLSSDTEFHEAAKLYPQLLKLNVSEPVMHQQDPLFDSWVVLQQQENPPTEVKNAIQQLETISSKIKTCQTFKKIADQNSISEESIASLQTPGGDILPDQPISEQLEIPLDPTVETKLNIRQLVQKLSQEIVLEMADLSSKIVSSLTKPELGEYVLKDLCNVSTILQTIVTECMKESDRAVAQVQVDSDAALARVHADSAAILETVHAQSQFISDMLKQLHDSEKQTGAISQLSTDVSGSSSVLSQNTAKQCIADADAIKKMIMEL